jgi:uncharacterized phage protein gp47/JayE
MAFQIKNFTSIVAGMINHMRGNQRELTDFNIGAVNRIMIEGPAAELDEAYQQLVNGLREAIPVATFNSFNFLRLPAIAASGLIRVTVESNIDPVTISAGTLFTGATSKAIFRSVLDAVIVPGLDTADVLVTAVQPGTSSNILPGETFTLGPRPTGFISASNLVAFNNGADEESDDQRKERFIAYINTLQRATVAALRYGARTVVLRDAAGAETERVRACEVIEPYLTTPGAPISLVNVFIHNGVGATTDALVTETAKVLHGYTAASGEKVPGWKAAGVKVVVAKATEKTINLAAILTALPGFDAALLAPVAEEILAEYVRSTEIGETFLLAQAIYLVKSIEGVNDFVFSDPTANVTSDSDEKLLLGTCVVTPA